MTEKATRKLLVVFISCVALVAFHFIAVCGADSQLTINDKDSYDFSANVRGELSGGDFYYGVYEGVGGFWANNLGQRGLQDLGDTGMVPLGNVAISDTNYFRYGVPAVVGHTYVSLAQEGEEGHVIVFRVAAISGDYSNVQILYLYESAQPAKTQPADTAQPGQTQPTETTQPSQMQPTDQAQPAYQAAFSFETIFYIAFLLVISIGVVSTVARFKFYRRTEKSSFHELSHNPQSTGSQATGIFGKTNFVFKHEKNDSITVLGGDSKPLFSVIHEHSSKMPQVIGDLPMPSTVRTTDVRIEGTDGSLLGEIHEFPTGTMRLIRKWKVFDPNGTFKGIVCEKPKFMGNDWVLQDVEGNLLAVIEGDRKKHNYEIVAADKCKQSIARCTSAYEDSYNVELMVSSIDPFLVLCYVIVLDLAKTAVVISGGGI